MTKKKPTQGWNHEAAKEFVSHAEAEWQRVHAVLNVLRRRGINPDDWQFLPTSLRTLALRIGVPVERWDSGKVDDGELSAAMSRWADAVTMAGQVRPNSPEEPTLTGLERALLSAMHAGRHFDSDHRITAEDLGAIVEPIVDQSSFKKPLARLVKLGLAGSLQAKGGGTWLTAAGLARAARL